MLFLPFAHSDFIFAVVGEELGLVGTLIVVLVFGIFLWRGMRAALRAPDRFGMLLGIGVVVGIVAQALLNMSVVLAMVPTKGIPLPFISYGGSSLVPTLLGVGILLNISQHASTNARTAYDDDGDEEEAPRRAHRRRAVRQRVPAVARARYG
jgi:cell division protein FtsW